MKEYIVTIVGGASSYTPGIVRSLMNRREKLPLKKLVLQDVDSRNLELMGRYLSILFRDEGYEAEVVWTTDREESFKGADFIFTQIRTGGLEMREMDEKISLKHGVVGQETCGPGGFAFAMRSIREIVEITRDVQRIAPEALIINYSNPLSILAEAVRREVPHSRSLFICDMPIVQELAMAATLGYEHRELTFEYFGLNHFGWYTSIKNSEGEELLPELREILLSGEEMKMVDFGHLDQSWITTFNNIREGVKAFPEYIPLTYIQYYYFPERIVKKYNPDYTRANEVMDGRRRRIYEECERVVGAGTTQGIEHTLDAHGDFIVDQAVAVANDTGERFMVNVVNNGTFPNLDEDMVIETFGTIDGSGAKAAKIFEVPPFYRALIYSQNTYEKLTVDACMEGSYVKALQALTLNPTISSVDKAREVLDALIEANGDYFPILK